MREVLPELMQLVAGRRARSASAPSSRPSGPRRDPPGASMLVGPSGEAVGSVSGGCVEGAVYELAQSVVGSGQPVLQRYGVSDDDAFAVGLTCGGILDVYVEKVDQRDVPGARRDRRGRRGRSPGGRGDRRRAPGPRVDRPPAGRPSRGRRQRRRLRARSARARADDAVTDDALGLLASGHNQTLSYGPDGERRGEGLRVFVWSFAPRAADARVRRHRLRRRGRPDRQLPRLQGHRLRRASGVRDQLALPVRRRGRREVAAQVPPRRGRGRPDRPAHGAVRADPRPEVRRAAARGRAAAARRRRTSARWARGAPTTTGWPGCRRPA